MKGGTTCLSDIAFVSPQIPCLFVFWLAVSGVEQNVQIDMEILFIRMHYIVNVTAKDERKFWNTVLNHLQLKMEL
ncbi:hypothetical protein IMY05_011G0007200 [Salix suchowensis]|nr:hypothetical protein IMY05_011G0007200 [Salix suchowensis]